MLYTIRYHFSQSFGVSAKAAYEWCTDFTPEDHVLMDENNAEREITRLTESTILLKETFQTCKSSIEKEKLVQLYPEQLMWVSTHLTGPNKYSQFLYKISGEDENDSRLEFTALHIENQEKMTQKEEKLLASSLWKYDSHVWILLAKAMKCELKKTNLGKQRLKN